MSDYEEEVMDFLDDISVQNFFQNQSTIDIINSIQPVNRKYSIKERVDPFA